MSLNYFVGLVGRIGQWSYLLLFVGAMLESAAMLGVLVPGGALAVTDNSKNLK